MKLLFKQKVFSWFASYNITDVWGDTVFSIKGQWSWGQRFNIYDAQNNHAATLKRVVFAFRPRFEIYIGSNFAGCIKKELTFFHPKFHIDFNGWRVEGKIMEWDYQIFGAGGEHIATVSKRLFNLSDTYEIDVQNPANALSALMVVLAIDAEKQSRG